MSPDVNIIVTWQKEKGIDYWVIEKGREPEDAGFSSLESGKESIIQLWQNLSHSLGQSIQVSGGSEHEQESIWLTIQGIGQRLYNELLSPELQGLSVNWTEGCVVCIGTNEDWIPWELIHDEDNFWGSKFILCRRPKVRKTRFLHSDTPVERSSSRRLRKIMNIIGGNLTPPTVVKRIKELFTIYDPLVHVETLEKVTFSEVHQSIVDADLIHFTCHGHTHPCCLQLGDSLFVAYQLTLDNLETFPCLPDSLVFANSCSSATIDEFLEDLITFGWGFYKKGAAAYIGTLGLVPTEYAITFSEYFYEKFRSGSPVGESLRHAKLQSGNDNPFWLLYTLYGDPFSQKVIINNS